MPEWLAPFLTTEGLLALLTLTALEIVLGIDNVVFIAVLCGRLPEERRVKASRTGIGLAVITRVLFLFTITWIMALDKHPLFEIPLPSFLQPRGPGPEHAVLETTHNFTWKDLVLLLGGAFLLYKSTTEIHGKITGDGAHVPGEGVPGGAAVVGAEGGVGTAAPARRPRAVTFGAVIVQIMLIDIVFSIDSVITAAGMSGHIPVMIAAVLISAAVMMIFAKPVLSFVNKNPTIKVLALSFLVLIGTMLIAESFGAHIPKGYIYFAMAFSLAVEILNMKMRAKAKPHV